MKKKIIYIVIFFLFSSLIFLSFKGTRYTAINYKISEEKISNYKKIYDFYKRYNNYKKLTKEISKNLNENEKVIEISKWIFFNIKKANVNTKIVDSHPWVIIERKIGNQDQFSDLLSVLLFTENIDSFYIHDQNNIIHPLTFFKLNQKWSVIDPYYGFYFLNKNNNFCSIEEHKIKKCFIRHFNEGNIKDIKVSKDFKNKNLTTINDLNEYYFTVIEQAPSSNDIENTNKFLRGGRSYIQKPLNRLIYQIQKLLNII